MIFQWSFNLDSLKQDTFIGFEPMISVKFKKSYLVISTDRELTK